ncbi:hypothetical protein MCOR25_006467 [Pyricularia grisea]|uniref:DUF7907 domain-containing protein n=1 Tax=Pyricularia grisea TaxID=148305 RepID=A0A6P8ANU8_PYRGI|nr:uncharacterized protein PgNI_11539 [Pyricularia grisea]KAI6361563.1 hypothetical protein MCOR25_006467 [Pyricularia grisea]TLD03707.1 hypothetical protein PgNI_11539 [Pyricularia grisea]
MLFSTAIISTAAFGLAAATPIITQRAGGGGPSVVAGKGFFLAVQGDLREMDPENAANNAWVLSLQRVATGFYASVIEPRDRDKTKNPTFYINGTTADQQTLNLDVPGAFPLSAVVGSSEDVADGENVVSFRNNAATKGLTASKRAADGIPILNGPSSGGGWAVCRRDLPTNTGPVSVMMPRFVKAGESAPEGCVTVDFVLLCKDLAELQPTDGWNHDNVSEISCVAN